MFSALPFAGSAAILLFSIRGSTIADDIFASAVRTLHGDRDHQTFYFFQDFCFYSITAFSFCPLPSCGPLLSAHMGSVLLDKANESSAALPQQETNE